MNEEQCVSVYLQENKTQVVGWNKRRICRCQVRDIFATSIQWGLIITMDMRLLYSSHFLFF